MTDSSNNLSPNDFEKVSCLFCDEPTERELYPARLYENSFTGYTFSARRERRREHYRIVQCEQCSLVYSNPVLSQARLSELYADSQFIFSEEMPYAARTYIDLAMALAQRHALDVNSVLEIGCSTGFFLEKAQEAGIGEVLGFEPSRECFEKANQNIRNQIVNDIFSPEKLDGRRFDLACMFQTVDHLRNPVGVVGAMAQSLRPGGAVLLVCHDVAAWSVKLLGENTPVFDVEHVYLFSQKTLSMLLESAGLTVLEAGSLTNTYPLGYWMRMLPIVNKLAKVTPGFIKRIPVGLRAGNLYAIGQKPPGDAHDHG